MHIQTVFDVLRQPEYTGDNRCIPCTINNLAIAAVVCIWLWVMWWPGAMAFGSLALLSIVFRGYLVPGTPTLTKRYLPDRVLSVFDTVGTDPMTTEETVAANTERLLVESGPLKPCEEFDDLCLTSQFRESWYGRMDRITTSETERQALAETLDTDGEIAFVDHGEAFTAHINGQSIGQWESHAAFVADLAAARELPQWIDQWDRLDVAEQGTLIRGLRVFIDLCPSCDGPVTPVSETVESCCREHTVLAISCDGCDARLFESVADSIERDPETV
ncbi:hypothetical protein [Halocatena salina]|uniref:Uncharacterized protein n=1 Tax=Halocatena salina TaxID=2934340 RepID=A0A8T9ZYQ7_9EURY|nr:hypothetical protein [Halocatena salina]UPM41841.1 hypothetical protein MW046_07550 [Halocatena salina]